MASLGTPLAKPSLVLEVKVKNRTCNKYSVNFWMFYSFLN